MFMGFIGAACVSGLVTFAALRPMYGTGAPFGVGFFVTVVLAVGAFLALRSYLRNRGEWFDEFDYFDDD